jgi:tRNA pseudouridine55 synthase
MATAKVEALMQVVRRYRQEINGWVVLDKPVGMTSTRAVSELKRLYQAKKAGHAGTLDPLASGILPIAFGEATKTVPFVQDGEKSYDFVITWGTETDTDDADGRATATSERRPERGQIEAALADFVGEIMQRPPDYSAVMVAGERAYDLARDGTAFSLRERPVLIRTLALLARLPDEAHLRATCGKGTYVRSLARDLGRKLGCLGHISALRRIRVGPFGAVGAHPLQALQDDPDRALAALLPVAAGLAELPEIVVDRTAAARLRRGQAILLRDRKAPMSGAAYAICGDVPIAIGAVASGELVPSRVFNLSF